MQSHLAGAVGGMSRCDEKTFPPMISSVEYPRCSARCPGEVHSPIDYTPPDSKVGQGSLSIVPSLARRCPRPCASAITG
eukprot:5836407-Prymnesium_polylepis.1